MLGHPACSLDLAPNDFFLFPKINEILKGRHFDDIDDTRSNTTAALQAIPQNQFQNCFEGWTRCWHQCMLPKGSTLKAIMVVFSNGYHSEFANFIASPHIHGTHKLHEPPFSHKIFLQLIKHIAGFGILTAVPVCCILWSFWYDDLWFGRLVPLFPRDCHFEDGSSIFF